MSTKKVTAAEEVVETKTAPETVVYIGPAKRGLLTGTVFTGGLVPQAEKLIDAVPLAKLLFVTLADLGNARASLDKEGSAVRTAYNKAVEADI